MREDTAGSDFRPPWPGPRPYREDESELLFGRDADISRLVDMVDAHPVVLLIAPSGVGKTSLLRAGLIPTLSRADVVTVLCRDWGAVSGATAIEAYCRTVFRNVKGPDEPVPEAFKAKSARQALAALMDILTDEYQGRQVVLIFDQFEELLRLNSPLGREFLKVVGSVAMQYYRVARVTQIVSLRREYKADLQELEFALSPSGSRPVDLAPVSQEMLRDVIVKPAERRRITVEDAAVDQLLTWWNDAAAAHHALERQDDDLLSSPRSTGFSSAGQLGGTSLGLLHLQALLWSVHQRWTAAKGGPPRSNDSAATLTLTDLEAFAAEARERPTAALRRRRRQTPADLLVTALLRYVEEAVAETGDPATRDVERTAAILAAKMAPHLSSGGYKLARDEAQLAWLTLAEDMETLGIDATTAAEAVGDAVGVADIESDRLSNLHFGIAAGDDTQNTWTAGRARDSTRSDTARELVRAFVLATRRLLDANILRPTPGLGSTRRYELVHDGFGPALELWSKHKLAEPSTAIESLTALRGRTLAWDELDGPTIGDVVSGVRWAGCFIAHPEYEIGGRLRVADVRFEGADLRGTVFSGCDFRNFAVDECELPGVIFHDCSFQNARIERSSMDGALFRKGRASNLVLGDLQADGIIFAGVRGKDWRFHHSALRHVTLDASDLADIVVEDSVVNQWYIKPDDLSGEVVFRNSSVLFIDIGNPTTAGHGAHFVIENCDLIHCSLPATVRSTISPSCNVFPRVEARRENRPPLFHTPPDIKPWKVQFREKSQDADGPVEAIATTRVPR